MAGGLIDAGLSEDQAGTAALGQSALNSSRQYISDLQAKEGIQSGLGALAGEAMGYKLNRKPALAGTTPDQPNIAHTDSGFGAGSSLGMMIGTMAQKILPGVLQTRQRVGQTTSTAAVPYSDPTGLVPSPTDTGSDQ